MTLAYCWSHARRALDEIAQGGNAPIAEEVLERTGALYRIERSISGQASEQRRATRRDESKPLLESLRAWLEVTLAKVPGGSKIAQAIRYALRHGAAADRLPR